MCIRDRKSTVAKKLAEDYGYIYVDTGAMYRAMALYFLRQGIDSHDEAAIGRACETVSYTHLITSPDGRILGKMGHNERCWSDTGMNIYGNQDMQLFASGVEYFK